MCTGQWHGTPYLYTRVGNGMVHRALACAGACATHGADLFCMVWVVQLPLVQYSMSVQSDVGHKCMVHYSSALCDFHDERYSVLWVRLR